MSETDCCFCVGKDWFRYRVGAIIIAEGYALFAHNNQDNYYYSVGGGVHINECSREAVTREVCEETGEIFGVERPLCLVENFFDGDGLLTGYDCHTIELYYLMRSEKKREFSKKSITTGGAEEKMCWLPLDKIDEFDVRPDVVKQLVKKLPDEFVHRVNYMRGK